MDVLTDSTYAIIIRLLQKRDTLIVCSCQCHTPSCSYGPWARSCGGWNPFGCRDNQVYYYTQVLIFFQADDLIEIRGLHFSSKQKGIFFPSLVLPHTDLYYVDPKDMQL